MQFNANVNPDVSNSYGSSKVLTPGNKFHFVICKSYPSSNKKIQITLQIET